jgi:hypothetical protein
MTLDSLQSLLHAEGFVLATRDNRLIVNAPIGALTAEVRQALQDHKTALVELLDGDEVAKARRLRTECPHCSSTDLVVLTHFRRCKQCKADWTCWDLPPPKPRPDYDAAARRGDELRAQGLALPLCWLPGDE